MNKVDVCYRDFGNFKGDKTIKVDQALWSKYIEARAEFEKLHRDLELKIKK